MAACRSLEPKAEILMPSRPTALVNITFTLQVLNKAVVTVVIPSLCTLYSRGGFSLSAVSCTACILRESS